MHINEYVFLIFEPLTLMLQIGSIVLYNYRTLSPYNLSLVRIGSQENVVFLCVIFTSSHSRHHLGGTNNGAIIAFHISFCYQRNKNKLLYMVVV